MKVSSTDILSGIIGTCIAVGMYLYAGTFPERAASAALYIRFLAIVLFLFSIFLLGKAVYLKDIKIIGWIERPVYFYATAGLLIVYIILLTVIGFFPASFLFMIGLAWILGYRKIISLSVGTISLLSVIYFVFIRFLSVPVPTGLF
ncbi:tripartite tricarboxylate transporter TctB family protein [bacterium]|nr:tripartite tricarboxylate transporter TctB family protein [bacterium]